MIARELVSLSPFAEDVEAGLTSFPKSLPSKWFYDAAGSALFEEITLLPEYYLTRTELEILRQRADEISIAAGPRVSVVELGSGTASKTCTLLQAMTRRQMRVPYWPVDISSVALAEACQRVREQCPRVHVRSVVFDFGHGFSFLRSIPGQKLVLYLGSSIGNFRPEAALAMLNGIRSHLSPGDGLLLGTDMVKDPALLVPAYADSKGVTEAFNKNLLRRINRELGADFDLDCFHHVARWNPAQSRMEMHLESAKAQTVHLSLLRKSIDLAAGEAIHTENSYKYTMPMVEEMLLGAGFTLGKTWFDSRRWFALHLARV